MGLSAKAIYAIYSLALKGRYSNQGNSDYPRCWLEVQRIVEPIELVQEHKSSTRSAELLHHRSANLREGEEFIIAVCSL